MFNKKKTTQTDTNINIKNYSSVQNLIYVLKNAFRIQKPLRYMLPLIGFFIASMYYIWAILGKVIIDLISNDAPIKSLIYVVAIGFLVQLIFTLIKTWLESQVWWRYIFARMKHDELRIKKVMTMDFENLETPKLLDAYQKAAESNNGNTSGFEGMLHIAQQFTVIIFKIIVASVILYTLNPIIILIMIVLSALNFINVNIAKKNDKKKVWDFLSSWWRKANYMEHITTNFDAAKDIRLFSLKNWLVNRFVELHKIRYDKNVESQRRWLKTDFISHAINLVQQGILYSWLIYSVLYKGMSIANLTLYLSTVATFYSTITEALNQVAEVKNLSRQINDFRTFVEYPDETKRDDFTPLPKYDRYEFEFINVSFKYPNTEHYALKNLNLKLSAGQRLAIVGLNGAGKTTLIKLLCKLYRPTSGKILLNGVDITNYDKTEYFTIFSVLFQNVEIFAGTIAENVSMKTPEETNNETVSEMLCKSGFENKLSALENGVHTQLLKVLYDEGIDLSGGEKQKLALARALYKNAPVVILDEPTSALDALAEYKLYQDFNNLIGDKTAIYISHRLSSTRFCNAIAMFKDGEMVEYGTHDSLMNSNGAYAEMFEVQSQYYKNTEDSEVTTNA